MVMPQQSHASEQFYPHGLKSISKGTEHPIRPLKSSADTHQPACTPTWQGFLALP